MLIMRNHGFLTVGETPGEAFMVMHFLIRGCWVLLFAAGSGLELDSGRQAGRISENFRSGSATTSRSAATNGPLCSSSVNNSIQGSGTS